MQLQEETTQKIITDIMTQLEQDSEEQYDELMDIGSANYKNGYGAIVLAIMEKYILIPKRSKSGN